MEDCCPHRLLPLSKGFLRGENLVCGYHGLEFNGEGRCVHMPSQQGVTGIVVNLMTPETRTTT
jgi:vanillate O-demethylase monooxygenase subunit